MGFEPTTSTLARWHSSQLNYRRKFCETKFAAALELPKKNQGPPLYQFKKTFLEIPYSSHKTMVTRDYFALIIYIIRLRQILIVFGFAGLRLRFLKFLKTLCSSLTKPGVVPTRTGSVELLSCSTSPV